MAQKQLMFDTQARLELKKGLDQLANAVKVTMGPTGRNVILDKAFGGPAVTKDGVTVAKEVDLESPFENMGAKMVVEVAKKTNDKAGDGTTTATVLAQAIFEEGLRHVTAGANPMSLQRGISAAAQVAGEAIKASAKRAKILKTVTPHVMRHSYATGLLEAGVDILTISRLLGHASFVTTMVYLHVRRPHLESTPSPIDWLPVRQLPGWQQGKDNNQQKDGEG